MMEKKMAFLEVKGLEKYFNDTQVLRGVDFTLEKGQVLSNYRLLRKRKDNAPALSEFSRDAR